MKKLNLLIVPIVLIISLPSIQAQESTMDRKHIIKTNVLIIPDIQQWTVFLDNLTRNNTQSNTFGLTFSKISNRDSESPEFSTRKSFSISYRRYFYTPPVFFKNAVFFAPYSKIAFRKVYQKGDSQGGYIIFPANHRDFTSTSVVLGLETGFQGNISERFIYSLNVGGGLGYVLAYKAKNDGEPDIVHLDAQFLFQVGYRF